MSRKPDVSKQSSGQGFRRHLQTKSFLLQFCLSQAIFCLRLTILHSSWTRCGHIKATTINFISVHLIHSLLILFIGDFFNCISNQ